MDDLITTLRIREMKEIIYCIVKRQTWAKSCQSQVIPLSTSSNLCRSLDEQTDSDGYFIQGALARYR
ncbi:hypothetical protein BpHYR1_018299 [Brachionus plicatilis]|uniref:Uncharacterized protein n=1 Tax=Brachionus plicatilis TaxID=10195 RepID=A0A3M7QXP6_BRAPC|nr:hypothetical protein BpHYR1_018299 [Brachionus plicatilis]